MMPNLYWGGGERGRHLFLPEKSKGGERRRKKGHRRGFPLTEGKNADGLAWSPQAGGKKKRGDPMP